MTFIQKAYWSYFSVVVDVCSIESDSREFRIFALLRTEGIVHRRSWRDSVVFVSDVRTAARLSGESPVIFLSMWPFSHVYAESLLDNSRAT